MRFLHVFFCALLLLTSVAAYAEEQAPGQVEKDEYDFSWLDPEKKIYVVQNRKYSKDQKLEIALSGGIGIGEAYRVRGIFLPRANFYFNDRWGVSVFGGFVSNRENANFAELKKVSSVVPTVRDVKSFISGSVLWLPFYAKMNMFNKIFYLDWHFELGAGVASTEIDLNTSSTGRPILQEDSHTEFHWGTGLHFFFTRNWGARLDYLALYYSAPRALRGAYTDGNANFENYFLSLGLSYLF